MRSPLLHMFPLLYLLVVSAVSGTARAAAACEGSPDDWIDAIVSQADRDAYVCLASKDAAGPALLARIGRDDFDQLKRPERVTRALALHLMNRLDRALTPDEVRALPAPDRRLLRDGIYARRGRKSPSPEHDAVFVQFDWYQPSETYTNGQLTSLDRENIDMIDDPPAPPAATPPPSAADAVAETAGATPSGGGCGCATPTTTSTMVPVGAVFWGLPLLGWARRRR